jgi:hypothetical protein
MAVTETRQLPAQFVEDLGKDLAKQVVAQTGVPVVSTGIAGITQQPGEDADSFKARQDAARAFTIRQQNLTGLAPQVAAQDALQAQAQQIAQSGVGSFQPFLAQAQQAATDAGTTLSGVQLGAPTTQQVTDFMSPFQAQVIDATLAEFDRNTQIQEQRLRDQQAALGVLGAGRAGVQLAEFGTGAARERAALQAGLLQQGFGQAAFLPQEQLDRYAAQVTGIMGGYPGTFTTTNVPNPTPLQTALGVGTTLAGIYGAVNNPQSLSLKV